MKSDPANLLKLVDQRLRKKGPSLPAEAVTRALRLATRFSTERGAPLRKRVGNSRFGGHPDLAAATAWPENAHGPLQFLAQLDLGEVDDPTGLLPERGLLSFFYDIERKPQGLDPAEAGGGRVLYHPDGTALQPTQSPGKALPTCVLEWWPAATLPKATAPLGVKLSDDQDEEYEAIVEELSDDGPAHQLFGWPLLLQTKPGELEAIAAKNTQQPGDWLMLMQLASDEAPGWTWGDDGLLYFFIRREDLAVKKFDAVWTFSETT
jgi:uncharacterized protein YwqG